MLIGIGGVSRAGKSTLADLLAKQYLSQNKSVAIFRQDEYPVDESQLPLIGDRRDWEIPQSIRHDLLWAVVQSSIANTEIIIIEGLFAFYHASLTEAMDKKMLVEISKSTFIKRKSIDLRWGSTPEPEWYVEHIWNQYLIHGLPPYHSTMYKVDGENYFNLIDIMRHLES